MSTSNVIIAWEISPLKWYNLCPSLSLSTSFPHFALPNLLTVVDKISFERSPTTMITSQTTNMTFTMTTNLTTCLQVLEDTINISEPLTRADGIFFAGWLMRFPANPMQCMASETVFRAKVWREPIPWDRDHYSNEPPIPCVFKCLLKKISGINRHWAIAEKSK